MDIGIKEAERKEISKCLSHLLADTYSLYLKAQNFHWNVIGPMFHTLHQFFEKEYQELALAVDQIAERIRALGFPTPASYSEFQKLSSLHEDDGIPAAGEMIRLMVEGHETVIRGIRSICPRVEAAKDLPTLDLLTQRLQVHEKNAWMLRSLLETGEVSRQFKTAS